MKAADDLHRQDRADVEAHKAIMEEKRRTTLCGCPACSGTGEVTEDESAFISSALAYYRSKNLAADPVYLQRHMILPRPVRADAPVMPASETATAEETAALAELERVETPKKPKVRHTPPPFLADE
ncbi:hypothetical protein [Methylobacterium sp. SD21]|uniref:hypothetical protein n=1 Tax=Methylobacterium litchii TaxID=3138810 RepID=UPI00313D3F8A